MAQRPNVLSPDQQEEGQAGTHLLSIPQDCRDIILEMVLLNREEEWDNNVIDYEVEPIKLSIPWVGDDEGPHSSPYKITDRSICIGNVGILRACRQLYLEGRYILYGRNSFISYNFPQLKYRLHRVIGRENMNIIEKLTIGLPMKHKQDPTPYLGGFLEFLKERLPNLTELNLTVQFYRFDRPLTRGSNISRVDEETRAMLNTSAWITCRHQKLKKAIWLVESGGIRGGRLLTFEEQQQGFSNDYEEPGQDLSDRVHECRLITKILATDRRFKIREQERIDLQPYPRTVAGKVNSP